MRLGGPIPAPEQQTPAAWIEAHRARGYRAAYCPLPIGAPDALIADYRTAAADADLVIAEVGAWSSPVSLDPQTRAEALDKCKGALRLAEAIGARCSVNVVGSVGSKWDGPDPRDLLPETVDRIIDTLREIIDAVNPVQTKWAIEMMPWMLPDSPDSYLELIARVDREAMAVHLDPVNIINSPTRFYDTGAVIRECFTKLGPQIVSCHAKDITLGQSLTVQLDECCPGTGGLDYPTYMHELDRLSSDVPLMLEHLPDQDAYAAAAAHIRSVAAAEGITL